MPSTVHRIERIRLWFVSQRDWHHQLDISKWQWHLCCHLLDMPLCSRSILMTPSTMTTLCCNDTSQANGAWIGFGKDALVFYQGHCIHFSYHEASNLQSQNWLLVLLAVKLSNAPSLILPFLNPNASTTCCLPPHASSYTFTIAWDTKASPSYRSGQLRVLMEFLVMLQIFLVPFLCHAC